MKKHRFDFKVIFLWVSVFLLLVVSSSFGYGYYRYRLLREEKLSLIEEIVSLKNDLAIIEGNFASTSLALTEEKARNDSLAGQVNNIVSKVKTLDKLSKTDPELLQKYSKIYFLNENYTPENLSKIDPIFVFNKERGEEILNEVKPYLDNLLKTASSSGNQIQIVSAYRSFTNQASIKSRYQVVYGSGANKFSADQGYSEHQLGTTIDFTTPDLGLNFSDFGSTSAYKWLKDNAHKYGFVLSYPEGNVYYEYEPWHWRFVGVKLATLLYEKDANFYDISQRVIDTYLVYLFD